VAVLASQRTEEAEMNRLDSCEAQVRSVNGYDLCLLPRKDLQALIRVARDAINQLCEGECPHCADRRKVIAPLLEEVRATRP
jgi:hypothetical protein